MFKVSPRHIIVKDCSPTKNIIVTLRPTVPILPFMNLSGTDSVIVSVLIPEKGRVVVDKCSVELKTEDITYGKNITINGICDNQDDRRQSYSFRFKPETSSLDWFAGIYLMPSFQVLLLVLLVIKIPLSS
jgi:hypothetical protein